MSRRFEILLLAAVIVIVNIPLLPGAFSDSLIYLPEKIAGGQWWRLFTHPFVHVSFYHLLLDGAAFLLLYAQLAEKSFVKRLGYLLGINAAVVIGVTCALPDVQAAGYCGLSGIAHGLMAVWCLERMGKQKLSESRMAAILFFGLLIKSVYETTVGHAFFQSAHLGDVGVPIVASHLWGIIGASIIYTIYNLKQLRLNVESGVRNTFYLERILK